MKNLLWKNNNIDGEKVGAFSYDEIYSTNFILKKEEIILIHGDMFFKFLFSYKEGEFDEEYITKIKDHMFNSIKWLNSTQMDD